MSPHRPASRPGPRTWHGVRLRRVTTAADPDSPPRQVTLPVEWDGHAAAALAALAQGEGPAAIAAAADVPVVSISRGRWAATRCHQFQPVQDA